jgi:hypothetical protein
LGSRKSEASKLSPKCTVLFRRRRTAFVTTWCGRRPYRGRVEDDSTIAPRRPHQSMFSRHTCSSSLWFFLGQRIRRHFADYSVTVTPFAVRRHRPDDHSVLRHHISTCSIQNALQYNAFNTSRTQHQKWPPALQRQTL